VPELEAVGFQVARWAGVKLSGLGGILAGQGLGACATLADAAGAAEAIVGLGGLHDGRWWRLIRG